MARGGPCERVEAGVLSQGTYGARVAVLLILELLDRHEVRATFFIPGRVAKRHPGRVHEIVRAGHEIAHHGYTHSSPTDLPREQEDAELAKGLEVLRSFEVEVEGYRSPSLDFSQHTEELLQAYGLRYSSNFMDDLRPYRRAASSLVEIPVHWVLDDAAHFWFDTSTRAKRISTAQEVRTIWEVEFRGYHRSGGAGPDDESTGHRTPAPAGIARRDAELHEAPLRCLDRNVRRILTPSVMTTVLSEGNPGSDHE